MPDMERMPVVKRLPPTRNWKTVAARRQALKAAETLGEWRKLAQYPPTETGIRSANQRAYSTPRSAAWKEVGTFETAVRYDVHSEMYCVYVKCIRRNKDGMAADGTPSTD